MGFAVWKLGGSLLDLPDLARRIQRLHDEQFPALPVVIIPGGGLFADGVRKMDQVHQLDPLDSHHLALDAMRLTASLVGGLLKLPVTCDAQVQQATIEDWKNSDSDPRLHVWDVIDYWNTKQSGIEQICGEIPSDWRLTSDSIAAALAATWGAQKLVLVKSMDMPADTTWEALAHAGAVDEVFPTVVSLLPCIEWVNLRAQ